MVSGRLIYQLTLYSSKKTLRSTENLLCELPVTTRTNLCSLMKCGNDSEMSQLDSQLFYKDTHGHLDDNDAQNDSNNALKERTTLLSLSTPVHMIAPIFHDVFQMERYLLNQVSLDLEFYQSKVAFYLMTDKVSPN